MIDLDTQLRDLFKKEEMLAFFDFRLPNGTNAPLAGLCKISKPKTDQKSAHYFSLLFLIDASPAAGWEQIHNIFKQVPWEALEERIPGVDAVLTLPYSRPLGGLYFQEIDIFFKTGSVLSKSNISSCLVPAVAQLCGCQHGEIVFWDNIPQHPALPTAASTPKNCEGETAPFTVRMRRRLGI
jgi:hypothetical protein